jgi:hypothetical protein
VNTKTRQFLSHKFTSQELALQAAYLDFQTLDDAGLGEGWLFVGLEMALCNQSWD